MLGYLQVSFVPKGLELMNQIPSVYMWLVMKVASELTSL